MKENLQNESARSADKKRLISILVGAVLVSLSPLALIFSTVPEMTPERWVSWVVAFLLVLWVFLGAGLALIVCPFVASRKWRIRSLLVCIVVATSVAYPWICQLIVGEEEVTGQIEGIVRSTAKDWYMTSPQTHSLRKQSMRKYDVIQFRLSSGSLVTVKLIRADVERLLALSKESGGKQDLRVVYLKPLKRLVLVEVANP